MIKETVNEYRFRDVLMSDEYASWSYGACKALFDYYEQLSDSIGEDIELDHVAIRCEWTEYASAWEAMEQYQSYDMPTVDLQEYSDTHNGKGMDLVEIQEASEQLAREWLEERTTVLDVENIDTNANEYRTIKSVLVMQF